MAVLIRNTSPSLGRLFKERSRLFWDSYQSNPRKRTYNAGRNKLKQAVRSAGYKSLKQAARSGDFT